MEGQNKEKEIDVIKEAGDKYRSILREEMENKDIQWRHGGPPIFDKVNKLFEEGRTKEWPKGSIEEVVQNAIKSWEMELSHKTRLQDFKTISPDKFKLFVNGDNEIDCHYRFSGSLNTKKKYIVRTTQGINEVERATQLIWSNLNDQMIKEGREGLTGEEVLRLGSYNALLKSSLPKECQTYYNAEEESFETSHEAFETAFPRGFAWEVIAVYSGPPSIAFKFRHWGHFEGPYKGHAPTSNMVQFYGLGILKVDESMRAEEVEIYYDPGELFAGLLKGQPLCGHSSIISDQDTTNAT